MIRRNGYLTTLLRLSHDHVTAIVGLRGCGKSTILAQLRDELIASGVLPEQVVSMDFDGVADELLPDCRELQGRLCAHLSCGLTTYLLLDEVQRVADYERLVNALSLIPNVVLLLAASDTRLLSSRLMSLLGERCHVIDALPLSFSEFREAHPGGGDDRSFASYLRMGGLPSLSGMPEPTTRARPVLEGTYDGAVISHLEDGSLLHRRGADVCRVGDLLLLRDVARALAVSMGDAVSAKGVTARIASTGRKVSQNTVGDHLRLLEESRLFYHIDRLDVESGRTLKTNGRYYPADPALGRHLAQRGPGLLALTECAVFLELVRRGFEVSVGKLAQTEVGLLARRGDDLRCYRVVPSPAEEGAIVRQLGMLRDVVGGVRACALTVGRRPTRAYGDVEAMGVTDWLLTEDA